MRKAGARLETEPATASRACSFEDAAEQCPLHGSRARVGDELHHRSFFRIDPCDRIRDRFFLFDDGEGDVCFRRMVQVAPIEKVGVMRAPEERGSHVANRDRVEVSVETTNFFRGLARAAAQHDGRCDGRKRTQKGPGDRCEPRREAGPREEAFPIERENAGPKPPEKGLLAARGVLHEYA